MGENSERKGCGDSWLRRGLHWQDGMAHHDRIVTEVGFSLILLIFQPLLQPSRSSVTVVRVLYVVNEGE